MIISLEIFAHLDRKLKNLLSFIIDDNCQYWKNLDQMILSSPNYPKWYNAYGIGCEWLISAPEGFIIALEFDHFHVINLINFVKKSFVITLSNIFFTHIVI